MSSVSPFKFTPDDLEDLDRKTAQGLEPLLEALNVTLQQLVQAVNGIAETKSTSGVAITDASGSVYINVTPTTAATPRAVYLDQLFLPDGSDVSTVFGFTWQLTGTYVRVLLVGLLPLTGYRFTLSMR